MKFHLSVLSIFISLGKVNSLCWHPQRNIVWSSQSSTRMISDSLLDEKTRITTFTLIPRSLSSCCICSRRDLFNFSPPCCHPLELFFKGTVSPFVIWFLMLSRICWAASETKPNCIFRISQCTKAATVIHVVAREAVRSCKSSTCRSARKPPLAWPERGHNAPGWWRRLINQSETSQSFRLTVVHLVLLTWGTLTCTYLC